MGAVSEGVKGRFTSERANCAGSATCPSCFGSSSRATAYGTCGRAGEAGKDSFCSRFFFLRPRNKKRFSKFTRVGNSRFSLVEPAGPTDRYPVDEAGLSERVGNFGADVTLLSLPFWCGNQTTPIALKATAGGRDPNIIHSLSFRGPSPITRLAPVGTGPTGDIRPTRPSTLVAIGDSDVRGRGGTRRQARSALGELTRVPRHLSPTPSTADPQFTHLPCVEATPMDPSGSSNRTQGT
ncbi:hypothetical protein GW17_00010045 [Ensete ventricosum]|nr:hypothetical protein GW17_00010045 [Ensete ventricosum]